MPDIFVTPSPALMGAMTVAPTVVLGNVGIVPPPAAFGLATGLPTVGGLQQWRKVAADDPHWTKPAILPPLILPVPILAGPALLGLLATGPSNIIQAEVTRFLMSFADASTSWMKSYDGLTLFQQTGLPSYTLLGMNEGRSSREVLEVSGTTVRRTNDVGQNWTTLTALPSAGDGGAIITQAGTILVMRGRGGFASTVVFRSVDGGTSWSPVTINAANGGAADGSHLWEPAAGIILTLSWDFTVHGGSGGLVVYRSIDDGATWSQVQIGALVTGAGGIACRGGLCFFVEGQSFGSYHVWRSTNNGATWTDVQTIANPGAEFTVRNRVCLCPNGDWLLAMYTAVWRSVNGGVTWTNTNAAPQATQMGGIWATDGAVFLAGAGATFGQVWRSLDNGATWALHASLGTTWSGHLAMFAALVP